MKVLKEESKVVKKIRKLEQFLTDNDMVISFRHDGLLVSVDDENFVIVEGETPNNPELTLPTCCEPTYVRCIENYISGI